MNIQEILKPTPPRSRSVINKWHCHSRRGDLPCSVGMVACRAASLWRPRSVFKYWDEEATRPTLQWPWQRRSTSRSRVALASEETASACFMMLAPRRYRELTAGRPPLLCTYDNFWLVLNFNYVVNKCSILLCWAGVLIHVIISNVSNFCYLINV